MASWSSVDQSYMNGLKSDSEDSESGVEVSCWDSYTFVSGLISWSLDLKGNNRGRLRSDSGYSSAPLSPVKSSSNEVQLTSEENFWLNRTAEDLTQLLFGLGMVDSVQECMAKLTATEEEVPKVRTQQRSCAIMSLSDYCVDDWLSMGIGS